MDAAFDTLSAADDLQEAGFSPAQARVLSQTMARAQGNLATKDDIAFLRAEMNIRFAALQKEISTLRMVIFGVVFPIMLANLGITVTLLIQIQSLRG